MARQSESATQSAGHHGWEECRRTIVKVHSAAALFPLLEGNDFIALAESIKAHGLLHPIVTYEGQILDGRNRARACEAAGVEVRSVEWEPQEGESPWDYVWAANAERRHLAPGQKAMLNDMRIEGSDAWRAEQERRSEKANEGRREKAKAQPRSEDGRRLAPRCGPLAAPTCPPVQRQAEQVALSIGVGKTTVKQAAALRKADPDRAAAVARGEVTLGKAIREVRHEAAKAKVAEQARAAPHRAVIHQADALDWLRSLPAASADLLLTDPPYSTDVPDIEAFARDWVPLALSRLKPSGRAYICTGAYPVELHAYLSVLLGCAGWTVGNVLVWTYRNTLGPAPRDDYKANWQAIFHVRGPDARPLDCPIMVEQFAVQDISAPDGRQGTRLHAWQKPDELAERLVRHATRHGDLVIDPFAGTGTFVLVAARLGREAKGADNTRAMLTIAEQRGCVYGK